jgi:glycosyltransferase involved in cell wall biosynthesis
MRICYICNEYPPGMHGGIGTMTQLLARALVRAGHVIRVVGAYPNQAGAVVNEDDNGVQIWRLRRPEGRFGWIPARYRVYRTVAEWVRRGEIDLAELPDWEGYCAGWPHLAVPVVGRLHGSSCYFRSEMNQPIPRLAFNLERASLRRVDAWCSVSKYTAMRTKSLFGLTSTPRAILYNPVEMPGRPDEHCRSSNEVVFTGTLAVKKGILTLFRAWPTVHAAHPSAILHLYGKGGLWEDGESIESHLMRQVPESMQHSVRFHGHVSRDVLFDAMRKARVAVFPSFAEAFAIAPLEAMACGCPTVSSARGSGPELLRDGEEGLLVDPDRPEDLVAAIGRVLEDDGFARRLGEAGRMRVEEHFAIGKILRKNEVFYEEIIRGFKDSRGGSVLNEGR